MIWWHGVPAGTSIASAKEPTSGCLLENDLVDAASSMPERVHTSSHGSAERSP